MSLSERRTELISITNESAVRTTLLRCGNFCNRKNLCGEGDREGEKKKCPTAKHVPCAIRRVARSARCSLAYLNSSRKSRTRYILRVSPFRSEYFTVRRKNGVEKRPRERELGWRKKEERVRVRRRKDLPVEHACASSEINSVDPDWKSTYNRKSFFSRYWGRERSRQMEGKNVEENKARDKWCSLCVSCGERPRLINRRIDTRYIRRKERKRERERGKRRGKTKDGRLSPALQKKREKRSAIVNLSIMTRDRSYDTHAHARTRVCVTNFPLLFPLFLYFLFLSCLFPCLRHARRDSRIFSELTTRRKR